MSTAIPRSVSIERFPTFSRPMFASCEIPLAHHSFDPDADAERKFPHARFYAECAVRSRAVIWNEIDSYGDTMQVPS